MQIGQGELLNKRYDGWATEIALGIGNATNTSDIERAVYEGIKGLTRSDPNFNAAGADGSQGIIHNMTTTQSGNQYTIGQWYGMWIYNGYRSTEGWTEADDEAVFHESGRPLIIHTGTKANQHLRVHINRMNTDALGIETLPVNPRAAAVSALGVIDKAIDYSLNENTRMGAYQSRLSYTIDNLVTASENTQSSESVIRDADMAKAMMDNAKYNILSQSAQAMLAQANQNSSGVLSLLQ